MKPTIADRLGHMREAAELAFGFTRGRARADLDSDAMLRLALTRAVEIIGEAATQLSEAYRAANPDVPWKAVIGMRNRLIHGYFDVDPDILWNTATRDLPGLIAWLEAHRNDPD